MTQSDVGVTPTSSVYCKYGQAARELPHEYSRAAFPYLYVIIAGYAVTLADGTDDAENWTISPSFAKEGQTVTVTYTGNKKIKSIKAIKE